jgi:hypothetical protein
LLLSQPTLDEWEEEGGQRERGEGEQGRRGRERQMHWVGGQVGLKPDSLNPPWMRGRRRVGRGKAGKGNRAGERVGEGANLMASLPHIMEVHHGDMAADRLALTNPPGGQKAQHLTSAMLGRCQVVVNG